MARRAVLGGFSLNPFGGGGVDASAFSIASQSRQNEAYLALTRVEVQWEAGKVSNADYLAALDTYVKTFPENSSERLNQQSRLESTTYRIERNVLVSEVESGKKTWNDLLAYDKGRLVGLNKDSQEYLDRQNTLYNTQNRLFSEDEKIVSERYADGKMTTVQYQAWFAEQLAKPEYAGNIELADAINERVRDLDDRVTAEVDSKTINDYSNGKLSPEGFLAYAQTARKRYADGSTQAADWDDRIEQAATAAVEGDVNYRYGLSQDYLRLQEFVQSNSKPAGGVSTSTSKRTIRTESGWKVVESTTSKPYAPSKSEVAAYKKRQVEVAEAKRQMAAIASKLSGMPGGFVQTSEMIGYYSGQLKHVTKGSQEWYAIQGKIDTLNAQASTEKVLARQGIKIGYPKVRSERPETFAISATESGVSAQSKAQPKLTDDTGHTLEDFKRAIAKIESGGRYDARNKQTGAYGKYQILPSNWANWAEKAGLPRNAPQTAENQEKVVAGRFDHLYKKYDGDFARMAAEWFAGAAGSRGGPSAWGPRTRRYVEKAMTVMGKSYNPGRSAGQGATTYGSGSASTKPSNYAATATPTAKTKAAAQPKAGEPHLHQVTGLTSNREELERLRRTGSSNDTATFSSDYATVPVSTIGMDSVQFNKVYDAMETAWQNGEVTAFVDVGGGRRMEVFLGDDPAERDQIMSELDNERISLADRELADYKGSPSEGSKSTSALAARKDATRHSLISLSNPGSGEGNVVARAAEAVTRAKESVAQEVALGQTAFENGDQTAAYWHFQNARNIVDATVDANDDVNWRTVVEAAAGRVGSSLDQMLAGGGKGGAALKTDLETLDLATISTDMAKLMAPADKSAKLLENHLKKDSRGQVIAKNGELQLNDGVVRELNTTTGKIDWVVRKNKVDPATGKLVPDFGDGYAPVMLRKGDALVDVYAKYDKMVVGAIKMPDGSKTELFGRAVQVPQDKNGDGIAESIVTYMENPLAPGQWSSTPLTIVAPKGATAGMFSYGSKRYKSVMLPGQNGETLILTPDEVSGQYQLWKQTSTGMFGQKAANEPVLVGSASQSLEAKPVFDQFYRDLSGLSDDERTMSKLPGAVVNMTPDEFRRITGAPKPGQLRPDAIAAYENRRGGSIYEQAAAAKAASMDAYEARRGGARLTPREVPKPGSVAAAYAWGAGATGAPLPKAPVSQPSTPPRLTPLPGLPTSGSRLTRPSNTVSNAAQIEEDRRTPGAQKPAPEPKPITKTRTTSARKRTKLTPLPTKKDPVPYSGPLGR